MVKLFNLILLASLLVFASSARLRKQDTTEYVSALDQAYNDGIDAYKTAYAKYDAQLENVDHDAAAAAVKAHIAANGAEQAQNSADSASGNTNFIQTKKTKTKSNHHYHHQQNHH